MLTRYNTIVAPVTNEHRGAVLSARLSASYSVTRLYYTPIRNIDILHKPIKNILTL